MIIDDILETGSTVSKVIENLQPYNPARIITVFLLRKPRAQELEFAVNYYLFDVHPESWVFGFGMDLAERYRHLRFICDDRTELYRTNGTPRY